MSRYERKMRFKNKTMEVFTWFIEGDDNHMHVETMALNKAIDIAIDCCFMEVIFETSNKNVTKMIKYEEDHRTMCGILGNNARKKMKRLEKKLGFVFLKEKQTAQLMFQQKNGKVYNNQIWIERIYPATHLIRPDTPTVYNFTKIFVVKVF